MLSRVSAIVFVAVLLLAFLLPSGAGAGDWQRKYAKRDFEERLENTPLGDASELWKLAEWAADNYLLAESFDVCEKVLAADPEHEKAKRRLEDRDTTIKLFAIARPLEYRAQVLDELEGDAEAFAVASSMIEKNLEKLEEYAAGDGAKILRQSVYFLLQRRRVLALRDIRNEVLFPDGPLRGEGFPGVDTRLRDVAAIWENSGDIAYLAEYKPFGRLLDEFDVLIDFVKTFKNKRTARSAWKKRHDKIISDIRSRIDLKAEGFEAAKNVLDLNEAWPEKDIGKDEKEVVRLINEYRLMMGLSVLKLELRIMAAAKKHTDEQVKRKDLTHESLDPQREKVAARIAAEGYKIGRGGAGEILAYATNTPAETVQAWRESASHHRILVYTDFEDIGVAVAENYWTVNMAQPE